MDDASSQIGQMLSAALDSSPEVRHNGEAHIKSMSMSAGFGYALVKATLRQVCQNTRMSSPLLSWRTSSISNKMGHAMLEGGVSSHPLAPTTLSSPQCRTFHLASVSWRRSC